MNIKRLNPAAIASAAALVLAVSACGNPFGVQNHNVRFVLSASAAAAAANLQATPTSTTSTDVQTQTVPGGPMLTGDHDGEHDGHWNPYFISANVTLTSILARDYDGVLVNVEDIDLPTTVDVVSMEGGREVTLPDGNLPPATYDQIVLVMSEVQGITHDSTTITIDPPGGGWTAVIPICPFEVAEGETAVVGLTLSVGRSFSWRNNRYHFEPHFTCDQTDAVTPDTATGG